LYQFWTDRFDPWVLLDVPPRAMAAPGPALRRTLRRRADISSPPSSRRPPEGGAAYRDLGDRSSKRARPRATARRRGGAGLPRHPQATRTSAQAPAPQSRKARPRNRITIFRATPYRKLTAPFCRFPLPTLVYRPKVSNLGDLLRLLVRAGAIRFLGRLWFSRLGRLASCSPKLRKTLARFWPHL